MDIDQEALDPATSLLWHVCSLGRLTDVDSTSAIVCCSTSQWTRTTCLADVLMKNMSARTSG